MLFHGSNETNPSTIYEEGFDLKDGLWGNAIYFSESASSSNSCSFKQKEGVYQIFYASVLLGN